MSAAVLSISEQKEALSGNKKKKKTSKTFLGIPSILKVECVLIPSMLGSHFVEVHEVEKLNEILERLLPSAKLPVQKNSNSNNKNINEPEIREEIKNKRNQLSLGVNALNRSIKKDIISAVLLAVDIKPNFLLHHLHLLCSHNKIPFLHLPGLRILTKNNLGFPCIAVGFKKNFCDFSEAVEEIKLISQGKELATKNSTEEIEPENCSEDEEETCNEQPSKIDETPFTYLFRTSTKERIFIPEKCSNEKTESKADFIMLGKDDKETYECKNDEIQLGISRNLVRKRSSKLKEIEMESGETDDDEEEDLQVPKKKKKKDWVIDKVGTRQKYYPANLKRVPSNPDRNRKKIKI